MKDRKYLRFYWQGQLTCLPNGLAEAPRKFMKILKAPFSFLRTRRHSNLAYIDDSCLIGTSFGSCTENVLNTMSLLDNLGFTIHPEKSVCVSTQILTYLGFVLNSLNMAISLTQDKANKIIQQCLALINRDMFNMGMCNHPR